MTRAEMRQVKAELLCGLLGMVETQGGTKEEVAEMYQYIIEQASLELVRFVTEKGE